MIVVVTGAAGFLGSRVAKYLLSDESPIKVTKLVLADAVLPQGGGDPREHPIALDIAAPGAADRIIDANCRYIFHLAAVVSGQAEADFDLGMRVNFDATRAFLETARKRAPKVIFVFTSTAAVYGGELPPVVDDLTVLTPQTSYGAAKAAAELLVNDYSRKGFLDGRIVRLPTVTVRAGVANKAVTSFVSGIIREPLNGVESICPVDADQEVWITGPETVVRNIVHAATVKASDLGAWRAVNLPGMRISVGSMLAALRAVAGDSPASLVRFERDEMIARMVATFPVAFDNTRALNLGFKVDTDFGEVILDYIRNELKR